MKITDVRMLCLSRLHEPENQWIVGGIRAIKADGAIVIIDTDAGITGIAESCAYGVPNLMRDWVAYLKPMLVGMDPLDKTTPLPPHYRSWTYDCTVAGIDCALWDIKGKVAGKPVRELLTAGARKSLNRVRLYASSGCRYDWGARPQQVIDEALSYIDQGYTAMKLRIGTEWKWNGVTVDRFLGLMRELTQTVRATGKLFDLAVDGNQRLTEEQALPIAKELERLGFAWFEEPIPQSQIDGYARIAASVEMPITGGEQFTTLEQFRYYFEKKAYDIVQPDMGWCGLTEGMRIADYAERYGVRVMPHNWHNGLMTMANGNYVAALPRPYMCELCMIQGPLQWEMLKEKPVIRDGYLELPTGAGLGVEIGDDLEARFPYVTGSWTLPIERTDHVADR